MDFSDSSHSRSSLPCYRSKIWCAPSPTAEAPPARSRPFACILWGLSYVKARGCDRHWRSFPSRNRPRNHLARGHRGQVRDRPHLALQCRRVRESHRRRSSRVRPHEVHGSQESHADGPLRGVRLRGVDPGEGAGRARPREDRCKPGGRTDRQRRRRHHDAVGTVRRAQAKGTDTASARSSSR